MKNEQNPLMKEKLGPLKNSKNEENVTQDIKDASEHLYGQ